MRAADANAIFRAAPVRTLADIVGGAAILVLAPHPDDESLGCGGLIAEAASVQHPVFVAILTDGGLSHPGSRAWPRARLVAAREAETRAALACLGIGPDRLFLLGAPDGTAPVAGPDFAALVGRLVGLIEQHAIGAVLASWRADPHCDHEAAAAIAEAACARTGARHLSYPVWAWMLPDEAEVPDPVGAVRLDIARHLPAKRQAIACHATQHGGLIDDDPAGFALAADFLAHFDAPTEVFMVEP